MNTHTRPLVAAALGVAAAFTAPAEGAFTLADIQFWTGVPDGPDTNQAVLVVDWIDGSPPLAWGYRWPQAETRTGGDLLAAVAGADPRLSIQGLGGNFVSHFGFDADRNGSMERFHPGFNPATNEFWFYFVNNEVFFDPVDFNRNGHIVPPATTVVPLGNPYDGAGPGAWVSSSTGVLGRPLADGSWDGFVYASQPVGLAEPVAATPVPEPSVCACLGGAFILFWRRRRTNRVSQMNRSVASIVGLLPLVAVCAGSGTPGPFAPAAGQPGSDAIAATDSRFKGWATSVASLVRGRTDIDDPGAPLASYGQASSALGPSDLNNPLNQPEVGAAGPFPVVSLGDGGSITLNFAGPIADGPGPDFAVFENSFSPTFLELALIEVSSDGTHFVRFPPVSCTPTATQVTLATPGGIEAVNLKNLAGKYQGGFGTPFDLAELAGSPELDVGAVTHVRIVDVVGSIDPDFGNPRR